MSCQNDSSMDNFIQVSHSNNHSPSKQNRKKTHPLKSKTPLNPADQLLPEAINGLTIESVNKASCGGAGGECVAPKPSRAAKKREKRAAEKRAQEEALSKATASAANSSRTKELINIQEQLSTRKLCIYEVPSDGDCLYLAVAHQLAQRGVGVEELYRLIDDSPQTDMAYSPGDNSSAVLARALRHVTAHHLRAHMDDFLPFLFNQETGEPLTDDEFSAYCAAVEQPSTWGGQVEVRALANALNIPIEVLQAECPSILIGEEMEAPRITIVYHRHAFALGEHYNSCAPLSGDG